MTAQVHLFAYLSRFSPTGEEKFPLDLEPGATVGWLIERLGIPEDFEKRVLVNGKHSDESTPLAHGDDVFIYPPAAGG